MTEDRQRDRTYHTDRTGNRDPRGEAIRDPNTENKKERSRRPAVRCFLNHAATEKRKQRNRDD